MAAWFYANKSPEAKHGQLLNGCCSASATVAKHAEAKRGGPRGIEPDEQSGHGSCLPVTRELLQVLAGSLSSSRLHIELRWTWA